METFVFDPIIHNPDRLILKTTVDTLNLNLYIRYFSVLWLVENKTPWPLKDC